MLRFRALRPLLLLFGGLAACGTGGGTGSASAVGGEAGRSGAAAGGSSGHGGSSDISGAAAGGASGAVASGPECRKLAGCCATLGAKRAACEEIAADDAGVEANCRVSHDLLCPTHTCADLQACCEKLQGQRKTNCLADVSTLGGNDPECSVAYGSLPECNE